MNKFKSLLIDEMKFVQLESITEIYRSIHVNTYDFMHICRNVGTISHHSNSNIFGWDSKSNNETEIAEKAIERDIYHAANQIEWTVKSITLQNCPFFSLNVYWFGFNYFE